MGFSLISLNLGKDKKNEGPQQVICQPKPSKWRSFIEFIQIVSCLVGVIAVIFAAIALAEAGKAYKFAAASLNKTEAALKIVQKPVLSAALGEDLTLSVRNIGLTAAESLKGYYRILYENQGVIVEGESAFFKQTLEPDQSIHLRTMLAVPLKDPKAGFLFFIVRIDSPSLVRNSVRIFYKNLAESAAGWSEADRDLWNLTESHRQIIARELRELELKF